MSSALFKKFFTAIFVVVIVVVGYLLFIPSGPPAIRPQEGKVTDPLLLPALITFADAVDASPSQPKPRMELGMTYEGGGLNDLAEQTYKQYAELFPSRVIGWYRMAIVQQKQGKTEEAIASLERGAEVAPEKMDSPHWQLAFWCIDVGDLAKASQQVAIAHAKKPNSIQVQIAKGRIALEENDLELAIHIFNNPRLISSVPDGYVYQLLGRAYRANGDEEKSRVAWGRAGQKKPNWPDPWTQTVIEHVVGLNAMRQEIMQQMQANNLREVRKLIDVYFTYDKDNRVVRRIDASWNAKKGIVGVALKKLVKLIEEDHSDTVSMILLAKLRMRVTQFQTNEEIAITKEILSTILEISPNHEQAKILLETLPTE